MRMFALALVLLVGFPEAAPAQDVVRGPVDLARTFASPMDGTQQPYRLYLPSAYDGSRPLPLLVALHGTGGTQNNYFDEAIYESGIYKTEAEQQGLVVLCPYGGDASGRPTEWRGRGELNVLAAIEDVQRNFCIDPDRIVCTGQSMGGTGTTYLCCRYPDLFAAGIPLASTYGHLTLITNLRHVPMFYVHGGQDWPIYAKTGPIPITDEMRRLGYNGTLWMIPEAGHNTMSVSTPRVMQWALEQRRVAHPRHITHRAYFPAHGRAWWVEIQSIERPGWFAEVDARVQEDHRIAASITNSDQVVLRPDPALLNLEEPLTITVNGAEVLHAHCKAEQQILLRCRSGTWSAAVEAAQQTPRTEWRNLVIGVVDEPPTWEGSAETTLGNWITDAMRDIAGADIAISTKGHYRYGDQLRGEPVSAGQKVHFMELVNWLRPSDAQLATFTLTGDDLLAILELNILDEPAEERFLVQVSGCRYKFDRRLPFGKRIVSTDIRPDQTYTVVCNSAEITRDDTLHLGPYFERLNHKLIEPTLFSTAWHYARKQDGRIAAQRDGRLEEVAD